MKALSGSKSFFVVIGLIFAVVLVAFMFSFGDRKMVGEVVIENSNDTIEIIETMDLSNYVLKDILTGEEFSIKADVPIILETFAVWCPTCLKQQKEIKALHEEVGDSILSISLNVDPNENEDLVLNHAVENGLDWLFAISPEALTNQLIEEFGLRVVYAPSAPVIILCPNGKYEFLKRGVKSKETLLEEVLICND